MNFSNLRCHLNKFFFFFYSAQYAKKNGLTQKKRMLAILGVSVAVMFLLVVSIVFCFVMKKKKGKEFRAIFFFKSYFCVSKASEQMLPRLLQHYVLGFIKELVALNILLIL